MSDVLTPGTFFVICLIGLRWLKSDGRDCSTSYADVVHERRFGRALLSLITHTDLQHLATNLLALVIEGPILEKRVGGPVPYLSLSAIFGIFGLAFEFILLRAAVWAGFVSAAELHARSLGYSTVLFAWGAYSKAAVFHHLEQYILGRIKVDWWVAIMFELVAVQLTTRGANFWAHLGGMACGLTFALLPRTSWAMQLHLQRMTPLAWMLVPAAFLLGWKARESRSRISQRVHKVFQNIRPKSREERARTPRNDGMTEERASYVRQKRVQRLDKDGSSTAGTKRPRGVR